VSKAAELISTPLLRNMGSIGGNLLLDTRCNYYDQNYEWRKGINFCMKKDGEICWVAPSSPRCWAVQSSDSAPVMVAIGATVKLISSSGERLLPAAELYNDDGINHLNKRPDELLTEIRLPPTNGWRATYWKLRTTRGGEASNTSAGERRIGSFAAAGRSISRSLVWPLVCGWRAMGRWSTPKSSWEGLAPIPLKRRSRRKRFSGKS
jgi:CO/xanthine dehydrogenase FAD-binding subunit